MTMYFLMKNRQMSALMNRATDNKPEVNGKKHISGFYLLKVKYEACKVELAELKNRQMFALINRATDNKPQVNGKKADCSYWHLKVKYAACKVELAEAELQGVVQELPNDLKEKAVFRKEIRRTQMKSDSTRNYDENKARLTLLEDENDDLAHNGNKATSSYCLLKMKYAACEMELAELQGVVQELRNDLNQKEVFRNKKRKTMTTKLKLVVVENDDVKANLKALMERNVQLEEGNATCCRVMEELRGKITKLSNANELLTSQVREYGNDNELLKRQVHY